MVIFKYKLISLCLAYAHKLRSNVTNAYHSSKQLTML